MTDLQKRPNNHLLWWLFAILWFGTWHYVHTWQVWIDPVHRVPGPIGDNTVMLWNLGWVRHALSDGHPGFWFANAYYPDGFLFLYGTHTWLDGLLGWLASPLLPGAPDGSILWANIMMAVATVGSGLAIIAALRAWGMRVWPILMLTASAVVFSWFRMFALQGHYHFYGTQWMLGTLVLLSYARKAFLESRSRVAVRLMAAGGLGLGLTFLNDQTMAVFAGILGFIIIASGAFSRRPFRWKNFATPLAIFYGLALLVASIHLIPIVVAVLDKSFVYKVTLDTPRLVDATSFFLPPDISWLGNKLEGLRESQGLTWAEGTYLGLVPILLLLGITIAAIRYVFTKPQLRPKQFQLPFYAAIFAWGFILIGLGDTLVVGREHFNAMPGRILKSIPVINNIRLPQRWVWPAQLCIALGGASLLIHMLSRFSMKWIQWLPLALAFIPGLEAIRSPSAPPVDYRNDAFMRPPGLIEAVQEEYSGGGVLLMPTEIAYAHSNVFQFQWGYDIPVTVAYTARMPFTIQELPWKVNRWTPETGEWLRQKEVRMIVFSFHDGNVEEYQPWILEAKKVIPDLVVLNRFGKPI